MRQLRIEWPRNLYRAEPVYGDCGWKLCVETVETVGGNWVETVGSNCVETVQETDCTVKKTMIN